MSEREPMTRTPTTEPRIVRDGWYSAQYGCPEEDWAWYIASSDRLTSKYLHERFRPRFDEHVAAAHDHDCYAVAERIPASPKAEPWNEEQGVEVE